VTKNVLFLQQDYVCLAPLPVQIYTRSLTILAYDCSAMLKLV